MLIIPGILEVLLIAHSGRLLRVWVDLCLSIVHTMNGWLRQERVAKSTQVRLDRVLGIDLDISQTFSS